MKRILILGLVFVAFGLNAQILNQTADWGAATTWSLSGTYATASLIGDPTLSTNFGFDDDDAGSGSVDDVQAMSAAIDLTAAVTGGETWLTINGTNDHRSAYGATLNIEYYDADGATWNPWYTIASNSTGTVYQTCAGSMPLASSVLDVSAFTATQQSGFQYRINYEDQGGWDWGFCMPAPTIVSAAPPSCIDPSAQTATNITNVGADLGWTEGGTATVWNVEIGVSGFTPTGTATNAGVANPYTYAGGTELLTYDFYVQADCGVDGLSGWVGPFSFTTLANCPAPTALAVANVTPTDADVSWTDNAGATVWNLELVLDGVAPTGTPTEASVANPYMYSSLTENTAYDYYVQADCGAGGGTGVSQWTGPFSFTTPCSAISPDYSEDFTTGVPPDCWVEAADTDAGGLPINFGSGNWGEDGFGNVGTTGAARMNLYSNFQEEWLITPEFDLGTGTVYQADFSIALTGFGNTNPATLGSDDAVSFNITTDGGTTWTALETWTALTPVSNAGEAITVDLTAYSGVVQFGFWASEGAVDDTPDNDFFVDNFMVRQPPSCVDPSGLSAGNTTLNSTDLSWTENGTATAWDLYYGADPLTAPDALTTPTEDNVASLSAYTISGLTGGTDYVFYVRADCGVDGTSAWVGPITERIPGPGEACIVPLNAAVVADCAVATPISADFNNAVLVDYTTCDAFGDNFGFWYRFTPTTASVIMKFSSVLGVEAAVFDACGGTEVFCNNSSTTGDKTISGLVAGNTYYMAIWRDGASTSVIEFCLEVGPNCFDPTNIALDAASGTNAQISWTSGGPSATGFELEYGPAAFVPGTGTMITTGTIGGPISISGLTPGTLYDVYVTEVCDGMNTGTAGPFSFATECTTLTPDYCTDFASYLPLCWDEAPDGALATGPTGTLGTGNWQVDGFGNVGTTGAARINLFTQGYNEWLLFPEMDLGLTGHGLFADFDIALTAFTGTGSAVFASDDQVNLVITDDGGTTWTSLQQWDMSTTVSATGDEVSVDLAAYDGVIQLAFYATDGAVDDPEDYNFYVDNVCVRVPPSCIDPTDLVVANITTSGADISLTENAGATMWDLEFVAAGATPTGVPTVEDVTTNPYTWTGGMQLTAYDVYMRSDCGDSESIWLGPVSFTTLAACPAPTALAAVATNTSAELSWTAGGTETLWDIEFGAAGFTPTGTPTDVGIANPYTEMGLTGETDYEYYVRADCGAIDGVSVWTGPFAFTTLCDALVPDACEEFTTFLPSCWQEASTGDLGTGPMDFGAGDWIGDTFGNVGGTASARINLYDLGTSDWLITPAYDLSAGGYQLDFNIALTVWAGTGSGFLGSDDQVVLLISEDGGATWTSLMTWDNTSVVSNTGEGVSIDLSAYTNAYTNFALYGTEGAIDDTPDMEFHVDDFCVATPPACAAPTFAMAANETGVGADLSWTENGTATAWDVEVVATGATPTGTPTNAGVTNPYTWTGGTPETTYDYYVRADCGAMDGQSTWVGPVSFTTTVACPPPTDLSAIPTNDSALLSWTEAATATLWDIEFGADGFTPTGTPTTAGVMNPHTETGLTAETAYDYYVRADCGAMDGTSEWSGPFSFTTSCDPVAPDVCEDFTGYGFGAAPACWIEATNGTPLTGPTGLGGGSWYGSNFGNNGVDIAATINLFSTGKSDWLISAPYDFSGGGIQLDFDISLNEYNATTGGNLGSDDEVELLISEDGGTTWTSLMIWDNSSTVSNLGEAVTIDLSAYTNAYTLLALYGTEGTVDDTEDMEFYVDNFCVSAVSTCSDPTAAMASNETEMGADFSWTESGTATAWDLEILPTGGTPTGTPVLTGVTNPYTWMGGVASTTYDYYVRASCGGSESGWVGPVTFTTTTPGDPCPPSLTLTGDNSGDNSDANNMENNASSGTITSDQLILSGTTITYDSATEIDLEGGFETEAGSTFNAVIGGCDNGGAVQNEDNSKDKN